MPKRHGWSWIALGLSLAFVCLLIGLVTLVPSSHNPTSARKITQVNTGLNAPNHDPSMSSSNPSAPPANSQSPDFHTTTIPGFISSLPTVSPHDIETVQKLPGIRFTDHNTTTTTLPVSDYTTVWSDDFSGTTLDSSKWDVYPWTLSYDRSCYTANNVSISSGMLDIRTSQDGTCGKPYSSGYIRNTALTNRLVSPTQSASGILLIEMRAQMPTWQKGIWPGLWTRNSLSSPYYGEIDLIEQWGVEASSSVVVITSHFGAAGIQKAKVFNTGNPLDQGMHTYSTEININNGGSVSYYVDSVLIATHTAQDFPAGDFLGMLREKWDARIMVQTTSDQQTYAGGARNDSIPLVDTHMKVDWVRYSLKN